MIKLSKAQYLNLTCINHYSLATFAIRGHNIYRITEIIQLNVIHIEFRIIHSHSRYVVVCFCLLRFISMRYVTDQLSITARGRNEHEQL